MDTAQFLARVSAPGNFLAIGYNTTPGVPKGFRHRFFEQGDFDAAAGFAGWVSRKGWDAYHALASFRVAEPDGLDKRGKPKFSGQRRADNAQRLKCFWIDIDLKREGDKKVEKSCYPDQMAAFAWLSGFRKTTGLPRPNLAVSSGYGIHVYWVLEDPLTVEEWQPHADAFKAALVSSGFQGDAGISADAARILRPPGTNNMKVSAHPAPVVDLPRFAAADVVNETFIKAVAPWYVAAAAKGVTSMGGTASALAGGNVSSILAARASTMGAATTANLPSSVRPRSFAKIAVACGQVAHSLATHGANDTRPVWYLGHLSLAHFCVDGANYVHAIGDGHAGYKAQDTDDQVAQIARELSSSGVGPPSCKHYELRGDPKICQACPHHGKLKGPWDLGVDDADLPERYRRGNGCIETRVADPRTGEPKWLPFLQGDVSDPLLDWRGVGGHAFSFKLVRELMTRTIHCIVAEVGSEDGAISKHFEPMGVHFLPGTERLFRGFLMAWIDKLIGQRRVRTETIHPWGWIEDEANAITGFAIGGVLYRANGTEEAAPGGDPEMVQMYKPRGSLAKWQEAFAFVSKGRLDIQVVVAASFASPLLMFTGHAGVVVSCWSAQSGVGKSAAMTVAQGVWASQQAMFSLKDTSNSVLAKVARTRAMVTLWDETRVISQDEQRAFSQMIFELTQGKERSRMRSDTSLRSVGLWQTILVCAANRPLMDYIVAQDEGTEAGALRIFEFAITSPSIKGSSAAARTISQAKTNYGVAGAVYGKWLAANAPAADKAVQHFAERLEAALQSDQSERLYIAAMATMLAGAAIASKLGIARFDLPGLWGYLCHHFMLLRAARRRDIVVSTYGYDLEQVLSSFMSDTIGAKIVTSSFGRSGPKAPMIRWQPLDRANGVKVQVSVADKAMRINRSTWNEWCRKRNLSGPDTVSEMQRRWGASLGRWILAAGTGFGGGQLWCVEIPLTRPELEPYLQFEDNALGAQPTRANPPPRGNQPTT